MAGEAPRAAERSLFIDQTAAILGVSRRTVYYRIRDGRLRTIRTRGGSQRVLLSSIEAMRGEGKRADGRVVGARGARGEGKVSPGEV